MGGMPTYGAMKLMNIEKASQKSNCNVQNLGTVTLPRNYMLIREPRLLSKNQQSRLCSHVEVACTHAYMGLVLDPHNVIYLVI